MRETRSYGSARGVRSNPYPYRDNLPPGAGGTVKTHPPQTGLRERHTAQPETPPPHIRAGFASLPGSESAAQSAAQSAANRIGITARIGGSSPAIGNASAAQTARNTPPHRHNQTKPAAKEKSIRPASARPKPDYLPRLTRPQRTLYAVP
jgi:hypothetical protein